MSQRFKHTLLKKRDLASKISKLDPTYKTILFKSSSWGCEYEYWKLYELKELLSSLKAEEQKKQLQKKLETKTSQLRRAKKLSEVSKVAKEILSGEREDIIYYYGSESDNLMMQNFPELKRVQEQDLVTYSVNEIYN